MKIKITKKARAKLAKIGFLTNLNGRKLIGSNVKFELPCDLSDCDLSTDSVEIGAFSYFGKGCKIYSPVKIGRFCSIAEEVKIGLYSHPTDHFSTSPFFYAENFNHGWNKGVKLKKFTSNNKVRIGDDVWIGAGVMIKGGVTIGDGVIIGCGAVVVKDVAAYEIIGGVPAKRIDERKVQQKFANEYKNWGVLRQGDFSQFIPLREKIKNIFRKK